MEEELTELRNGGYASDTPFQPSSEGASEDVSNLVWVGNLPIVPEDKNGKLTTYARTKIFEKVRLLALQLTRWLRPFWCLPAASLPPPRTLRFLPARRRRPPRARPRPRPTPPRAPRPPPPPPPPRWARLRQTACFPP
jgi:hypothetical protein